MVATVPPLNRSPIRGHDPGTNPHPVLEPAPTRLAQKRDYYIPPAGEAALFSLTVRGPFLAKLRRDGAGEKPAGKRLAPEIGHRVDTDQEA